jgi:hypothetical protein
VPVLTQKRRKVGTAFEFKGKAVPSHTETLREVGKDIEAAIDRQTAVLLKISEALESR